MQPVLFAAVLGLAGPALGQAVYLIEDPAPPPFVDIASLGELLDVAGDGEVDIGTFAGNFVFRAGTIVVGQNGGMAFGPKEVTTLDASNQPVPSGDAFLGGPADIAFGDERREEDESTLGSLLEDLLSPSPEEEATRELLRARVRDSLGILSARERRVIELRFGITDGRARTLDVVGNALSVTRERARQIEAQALSTPRQRHQRGLFGDE